MGCGILRRRASARCGPIGGHARARLLKRARRRADVRTVSRGRQRPSHWGASHRLPAAPGELGISRREIQVLYLISQGLANYEIAGQLHVSEETVKSHVRNLLRKLGANGRAHAVAIGFRRGLIR